MKITLPNAVVFLLFLLGAAVTFKSYFIISASFIIAAVVTVVMFMLTSKGRTFWEWRKLARHRKTTARADSLIFSMENNAVTWDGNRLSMFLELTPSPFHVTAWKSQTDEGLPTVPLDVIADTLRQYDITLDHISVISHGYITESSSPYNVIYASTASYGKYSRFRTIIEVSIKLATSLNSIDSRRGPDDGPEVGAARTVNVATQRLMRTLIDDGWYARPMTRSQVTKFDDEISTRVGDAFENEMSNVMGYEKRTQIYSINDVEVHPQELSSTADSVTIYHLLRPESKTQVNVNTYVMLTGNDPEDTDVARGYSIETGVQGDLLSQILPLAPFVDTLRRNTVTFSHPAEIERVGQALGTGIFLGNRYKRKTDKLFMSLIGSKDQTLYIASHPNFLRNLITRAAAAGETVDIMLPDPTGEWKAWVNYFNSPHVRLVKNHSGGSILVVNGDSGVSNKKGVITFALCTNTPPRSAKYAITSVGDNVYNIKTAEDGVSSVIWVADRTERVWLRPTAVAGS